jgi:hypothetical protein
MERRPLISDKHGNSNDSGPECRYLPEMVMPEKRGKQGEQGDRKKDTDKRYGAVKGEDLAQVYMSMGFMLGIFRCKCRKTEHRKSQHQEKKIESLLVHLSALLTLNYCRICDDPPGNSAAPHPADRRTACFSAGPALASEKVGGSIGTGIHRVKKKMGTCIGLMNMSSLLPILGCSPIRKHSQDRLRSDLDLGDIREMGVGDLFLAEHNGCFTVTPELSHSA